MNRFEGNSKGRRQFGGGFGARRQGFDGRPREMHKAVCSDCKQDCEVPFKPIEGKQIYCKECYPKHRKF